MNRKMIEQQLRSAGIRVVAGKIRLSDAMRFVQAAPIDIETPRNKRAEEKAATPENQALQPVFDLLIADLKDFASKYVFVSAKGQGNRRPLGAYYEKKGNIWRGVLQAEDMRPDKLAEVFLIYKNDAVYWRGNGPSWEESPAFLAPEKKFTNYSEIEKWLSKVLDDSTIERK